MFAGLAFFEADRTGTVFVSHIARAGNHDALRLLDRDLMLPHFSNLFGSRFRCGVADQWLVKCAPPEKPVLRVFDGVLLNGFADGFLSAGPDGVWGISRREQRVDARTEASRVRRCCMEASWNERWAIRRRRK